MRRMLAIVPLVLVLLASAAVAAPYDATDTPPPSLTTEVLNTSVEASSTPGAPAAEVANETARVSPAPPAPEVLGTSITRSESAPVEVAGLALTGADVAGLVAVALAAVAVGVAAVRIGRRRTASASV